MRDAVRAYAEEVARSGSHPAVDVLGRYRRDQEFMPGAVRHHAAFRTVHGAKGLEADYVVLPNVGRGILGFPSGMSDDPVLAMTEADPFPHAEERRLFYVALTRAKQGVLLLAVRGFESPFLVELIEQGAVDIDDSMHAAVPAPAICPRGLRTATLVERSGPYRKVLGVQLIPRVRWEGEARALAARIVPDSGFLDDLPLEAHSISEARHDKLALVDTAAERAVRDAAMTWLDARPAGTKIDYSFLATFEFNGTRIPLKDYSRGIRHPKGMRGALSISTTFTPPGPRRRTTTS